jgi:hypothetical protein
VTTPASTPRRPAPPKAAVWASKLTLASKQSSHALLVCRKRCRRRRLCEKARAAAAAAAAAAVEDDDMPAAEEVKKSRRLRPQRGASLSPARDASTERLRLSCLPACLYSEPSEVGWDGGAKRVSSVRNAGLRAAPTTLDFRQISGQPASVGVRPYYNYI